MYAFISALKWHCQAQDTRILLQQSLIPLLRVELHQHRMPLETEEKRSQGKH